MKKICKHCGQIFDARNPNSKYCDICRPIVFKELGKAARRRYYLSHRDRIIRHNAEHQRKKRSEQLLVCEACGAEFHGHGNRKYCDSCQKNANAVCCEQYRERRKTQAAVGKAVQVNQAAVKNLRERYLAWRLKNRET